MDGSKIPRDDRPQGRNPGREDPLSDTSPIRREENALSFRQFLARGSGGAGARPKRRQNQELNPIGDPPENIVTERLPDFVKDYMSPSGSFGQEVSENGDRCERTHGSAPPDLRAGLPDFTADARIPCASELEAQSSPSLNGFPCDLTRVENRPSHIVNSQGMPASGHSSKLPDFLPDSAIPSSFPKDHETRLRGSAHGSAHDMSNRSAESVNLPSSDQPPLRFPNRCSASDSSTELSISGTNGNPLFDVNILKEQLDENIMRRIRAEREVLHLQQKLSSVEEQLKILSEENAMLRRRNLNPLASGTIENTVAQIYQVADNAEHHLRQLLSGVDSLRLITSALDAIETSTNQHVLHSEEGASGGGTA